jgi:hypothetical protein
VSEAAPAGDAGAIAARMRVLEGFSSELRRAAARVGDLVATLPEAEPFLFSPDVLAALRTIRGEDAQLYLVLRQRVRERSGRAVVDLLDAKLGVPPSGARRALALHRIEDLLAQPAPAWLVERLLPERGLAVLYGPPGGAKTSVAIELARCVALGEPFFGRETAPGGFVYLSCEGRMRDRFAAQLKHHDLAGEALRLIRVIEDAADLSGPTVDLEDLKGRLATAQEELGFVAVLAIDTLSRVLVGGDENSAEAMGRFISVARELGEVTGGLVLVLHHAGKDESRGARGHSSLRAAADTELAIVRDGALRRLIVRKQREDVDGAEFGFRLEEVSLEAGRSSVVVVAADAPAPGARHHGKPLTMDERVAIDALREEIAASGSTLAQPTSEMPAGHAYVAVEAWRSRFHQRLGEAREADARRQAWRRARAGLIARRIVGCWGEFAWFWSGRDRDNA